MQSILPETNSNENQTNFQIGNFLKRYHVSRLLRQSNFDKEKGFSCFHIFRFIFILVFTGKNLYRFLHMNHAIDQPEKDTIYRFLNSTRYNWRKFLLTLSTLIIKETVSLLTSAERVKVLIFDDSLFSRNRSKAVELLAKVYDHTEKRYMRGFRMLTLGWSDGNTFLPLSFSLLSSENEKNRLNGINSLIDKRTNGFKLRKESMKKTTEVMFELLDQLAPYGAQADYLLFDSWYAFPKVILNVMERNLHVICMLKAMPKVFYQYVGKSMNLTGLYNYIYKKPGRARILASVIVELGKDMQGQPVKVKIVFVRDRNRSRKWLALLSTDTALSDEEIIRIYGKRWDIEVFFKMSKSYLKLAKEFQGRSYDSMVAHTTIVFCRYIMLALESRNSRDLRTIGNLFYTCCDELQDISFVTALFLLFDLLKEALREHLSLSGQKLEEFISQFISSLPSFFKDRLQLSVCES
ncbi:transposase [Pelotomaculum isophthalicicum JI]|uniref:Transposase n=1 Tax=Pelotomaculum isophthalicicum JI TaxID=947010 RepID=A0A9X4JWV8_9FIRM|nr:transposase [Pelotomaculum isophthalicicum]MDF9410097.1 transposase [Pelotomaculum isophthalicicum JI]